MPRERDWTLDRLLQVALVEPEIPWNAGNACLAAGARLHLVQPLGFSLDERHLRRAGLDYWRDVDSRVWPSWRAFQAALPRLGEPYFFTSEGGRDYWSVDYGKRPVLLFGGESAGFSQEIRERFEKRLIAIPMRDRRVRSLNLSTAAAVAVYEVLRQWGEG